MKKVSLKNILLGSLLMILVICVYPITALAATASVHFGSESYTAELGEEFPIGIYISGDNTINSYQLELKYDNLRMQYMGGADEADEENGILYFYGNTSAESIKLWVTFKTISGGETSFKVNSTQVEFSGGEKIDLTSLPEVPLHLDGDDVAADSSQQTDSMQEEEASENNQNLQEENDVSPDVQQEEMRNEDVRNEDVSKKGETTKNKSVLIRNIIIITVIVFLALTGIVIVRYSIRTGFDKRRNVKKRLARKRRKRQKSRKVYGQIPNVVEDLTEKGNSEEGNSEEEKPVISVRNVTMKFKTFGNNTSGLKDFIIQKIKHQIKVQEFIALDDVSFDVFRGEVVGIIGTNGAGKSTLLKIVSGALNPSGGEVVVDKKKIQLLSLGAGFDSELSARENVYLNGAIIGYSKEFIDEHYDEIVKFAELEGFMDKKVKNFSSGMVSRLGFAIATAGDAAEILILDEVLSVGDEFFRKKSLARVKEMIHSGSTVLMVSHGMSTIVSNCTKVVWIEKGKLQMVGDAQIVCAAYRRQFNQ